MYTKFIRLVEIAEQSCQYFILFGLLRTVIQIKLEGNIFSEISCCALYIDEKEFKLLFRAERRLYLLLIISSSLSLFEDTFQSEQFLTLPSLNSLKYVLGFLYHFIHESIAGVVVES